MSLPNSDVDYLEIQTRLISLTSLLKWRHLRLVGSQQIEMNCKPFRLCKYKKNGSIKTILYMF